MKIGKLTFWQSLDKTTQVGMIESDCETPGNKICPSYSEAVDSKKNLRSGIIVIWFMDQ